MPKIKLLILEILEFLKQISINQKIEFQKQFKVWYINFQKQFKVRYIKFNNFFKKGKRSLVVTIIPYNKKQMFDLHLNINKAIGIIVGTIVIIFFSIFILFGKSGKDLAYYTMGLNNNQLKLKSIKMAEEMIFLHKTINQYNNTITELSSDLNKDLNDIIIQENIEITQLKKLLQKCKIEFCNKKLTKEILIHLVSLSKQDNQNLQHTLELSNKIFVELRTKEKQNILKHMPNIWPTVGYLISSYGHQTNFILGKQVVRQGIEIGALPGTEVYATASGKISNITWDKNYGLTIKIKHRYGMYTYYSHLDKLKVNKKQKVDKGEVIGYVGRSGNTPIYMLYYEVHVGAIAYNPFIFLNYSNL